MAMISSPKTQPWDWDLPQTMRRWTAIGFWFTGFTVLGFVIWANAAQISGAVIANGVFVTTGTNKTIQHLEGGVIRKIMVKEGDIVSPGQPLILLDDTIPKAELRRDTLRYDRLAAMQARLLAEVQEKDSFQIPPDVMAQANDKEVAAILNDQRITFAAQRNALNNELSVLSDGVSALNQKIEGAQAQTAAMQREKGLFGKELAAKETLAANGLVRRPELLALQRASAAADGEIGRLSGEVGEAREEIVRIHEQIVSGRSSAVRSAAEELHRVQADLNDAREQKRAAQDVVSRVNIVSPVRGVVVKLRYHTVGGVIEAGKGILDIVPLDENLIIEGHIRPQDIENVKLGQVATVRLTALNQRSTPMVTGTVIYVSADTLPNETPQSFRPEDEYLVRVRLDPSSFKTAGKFMPATFTPVPGMPAEIYIKTRERTFFEYIFRPIKDSMSRAFREP